VLTVRSLPQGQGGQMRMQTTEIKNVSPWLPFCLCHPEAISSSGVIQELVLQVPWRFQTHFCRSYSTN
jgi:hypothetical protein